MSNPGTQQRLDDLAALTKVGSMLIILLATCKQSLVELEAAANVLDTDLTRHLTAMIKRSEDELAEVSARIQAQPGSGR